MAVIEDEEWEVETWFVRRQLCGTCMVESVVTGPRRHVDGVGAEFADRHARCMGRNSMVDPEAVERRRLLAAEEARRRAAVEAATRPAEAPAKAKATSPRQQAFDSVFGTGK